MTKMRILAAVILLAVGIALAKNVIVRVILQTSISKISGLALSVKQMEIGVLKPTIAVRSLTLFNPSGFDERTMFEVPLLYVRYNLFSILRNRIHIYDMDFDLKYLNVIKNKDGRLNLDALNIARAKKERALGKRAKRPMPGIAIDKLHLKVGKVVYKDYAQNPSSPKIVEYDVNLDERYENINDPYTLGSLIITRALMKTNVERLTGFDLGPLQEELVGTIYKGREALKKTTAGALGVSKDIAGEAGAALKTTKAVLQEAFKFQCSTKGGSAMNSKKSGVGGGGEDEKKG